MLSYSQLHGELILEISILSSWSKLFFRSELLAWTLGVSYICSNNTEIEQNFMAHFISVLDLSSEPVFDWEVYTPPKEEAKELNRALNELSYRNMWDFNT